MIVPTDDFLKTLIVLPKGKKKKRKELEFSKRVASFPGHQPSIGLSLLLQGLARSEGGNSAHCGNFARRGNVRAQACGHHSRWAEGCVSVKSPTDHTLCDRATQSCDSPARL